MRPFWNKFAVICQITWLFSPFFAAANEAQELFQATLYEQAIPLFEKEAESGERQAIHSLGACYLATGQYLKTIELLEKCADDSESRFLLASAYLRSDAFDKAVSLLAQLDPSNAVLHDLGIAYFKLGDWEKSAKALKGVSNDPEQFNLFFNAQLFLIRLDFEQGRFEEAEKTLSSLDPKMQELPEFSYQISYVKGELLFHKKQFAEAAVHFENAIPKRNKLLASWINQSLYYLGWCYVKMAETGEEKTVSYEQAEKAFAELIQLYPEENALLAYAHCMLCKGRDLKDGASVQKAHVILNDQRILSSQSGRNQALLIKAQFASTYEEREKLYHELTKDPAQNVSTLVKAWYLRSANELSEAREFLKSEQRAEAKAHFDKAVQYLEKTYDPLEPNDFQKVAHLQKQIALTHYEEGTQKALKLALEKLNFLSADTALMQQLDDPLEIFYCKAIVSMSLNDEDCLTKASMTLKEGLRSYPSGGYKERCYFMLGSLYYRLSEFDLAEEAFVKLGNDSPLSPLASEAFYWAARSAENLKKDPAIIKGYKQRVFENYADCAKAAECFFTYYSYPEYLQGDRKALKHLQALTSKYPQSPFVLNAFYLQGMDLKRDRKSPEGKWIRRKNLTAAIESFQKVDQHFNALIKEGSLSNEDQLYYVLLYYRSMLERALANYEISENSKGAKRQIYLEYAKCVFIKIKEDFLNIENPWTQMIKIKEVFPKIEEESRFWLSKIYWDHGNAVDAEKNALEMFEKFRQSAIEKSYFLAKLWYERGKAAFQKGDYELAMESYKCAEQAGSDKILNTDETLDISIEISLCYQKLGKLDQAMLILSRVINCAAVSSLRIKAMFLRAEIYELQSRPNLAKRQLETVSLKGGEWGLKALEKLEKEYGYE